MEHIGIDVHKVESQICILTENGEIIERRIRTERERFAAVLGERPRAKILIEADLWNPPAANAPAPQTLEPKPLLHTHPAP